MSSMRFDNIKCLIHFSKTKLIIKVTLSLKIQLFFTVLTIKLLKILLWGSIKGSKDIVIDSHKKY